MPVTELEREEFFQRKILEKYGNKYGITQELLKKIDQDTATEAELITYTDAADKLVMRFKSDLRSTEPKDYSNIDLEIIMAMIDANYLKFKNNHEPYSKVIPESGVQGLLSMQYGNPSILNFSALSRYSEDLSPQQVISQFGLDYEYQSDGETVTPYLAKDGTKTKRQPFVFAIETPMNESIQANAKLPIDPRIMERLEQMATETDSKKVSAATKQQAEEFLARNKDNFCMIVHNIADRKSLEEKYGSKYEIINAQNPPYTGNTAPQYGKRLEAANPYADVIQEMYVTKPTEVSPGTKIYGKFPREGGFAERSDLPAGSEKIEIARWDGQQWELLVNEQELQVKLDRVLADYPENLKQQWESKKITGSQLRTWKATGDAKIKQKQAESERSSTELVTSLTKITKDLKKLETTSSAEKSKTNQQAAISLEKFMEAMTEKYKQDFVDKVQEHSDGSIDQTKAEEYFRTFVKALYNNRIEGLGKGYGNFDEGGAEGEKGRQNLVDAFYQETSEFIRAFGPVAAQGSTLLWSSYGIGRFAVDDKEILKSAGVTDENAQALSQTAVGKVWDKLKIAAESDEQIGYIWDSQYQVWASVSKELAANAEGEVHVFLPKNIGASTVFWNVELPELRKRMAKFTDDPKVTKITIHRLTDDALKRVNEAENDAAKKQVMLESSSWENLDFSEASLEVPQFSDKQKELLKDSNPSLFAQMENYVSSNKTAGTITIRKLTDIARRWKKQASKLAGMDIELYRKIADKYGHFASVPFEIAQKIAKGEATDGELKQYADKLVKAFQNDLSKKQPQDYSDSDIEIITRLLHENYTRLQKPASQGISTKVISKTEIENLLKKESGDPKLAGFNNFYEYSEKLSAKDTIEQFGLDYQYAKDGQTVKPYLMSENGKDKTVPFVYYVMTPMTDDIKNNARIPLDPTVKTKLLAIASDSTRDENDELKKMAQELTTTGVYHELTPNTGDDKPKYGTQADGRKSYADMLRTTYSTSGSQMSIGATIRAKGPNGKDVRIAGWNGLTWTVSPQSAADLPDWLKTQGRTEDRLNVDTELKAWKTVGDNKITPPTNIPAPVRAFMEHHFQTSLADITIQKVANSTTNDDSTSTVIKFKPGEYDDTTEDGLKKIAQKLGDAVKLKVANNGNQLDVSKAITEINKELPTKSASIKNELMKLRKLSTSFADRDNAVRKSQPRYNTGKTHSNSSGNIRASSR